MYPYERDLFLSLLQEYIASQDNPGQNSGRRLSEEETIALLEREAALKNGN